MKLLTVLFAVFATSYGAWFNTGNLGPGLRVTWGIGLHPTSEQFFDVPRNVTAAEAAGWQWVENPDQRYPSLVLYCPEEDYALCTYYDENGLISGLQIALGVDSFTNYMTEPEQLGFVRWTAPDCLDYWATSQFFVSEEYLAIDPAQRLELYDSHETLRESAVWLNDVDGELTKINGTTGNDDAGDFTEQGCIPGMGLHRYHQMHADTSCDRLMPWFTMTDERGLVGTGFMTFGTLEVGADKNSWFEFPPLFVVNQIVPRSSECFSEIATSPGAITVHIYYIDAPGNIGCTFN